MSDADDRLEGFRGTPEMTIAEKRLYGALNDPEASVAEARRLMQAADSATEWLATPIGQFVDGCRDEIEQAFLTAAQAKPFDKKVFEDAHFEYMVATQAMMWIGEAIDRGQEMMRQAMIEREEGLMEADVAEPSLYPITGDANE